MDIFRNFASGVLSAAPGAAGTTLTSVNFGALPVVAAPNTMRLALDPDGLAGAPEIVTVTAHANSATTCTVLRGQESAYGAGAARAHAIDTVWRMVVTRASLMELAVPPATISATVASTADPGYALMNGQTIVNADSLYTATWNRVPAAWKSGTSLVLPDWRGRLLVMDDAAAAFTLGGVAGANSHNITQAELPAATITIDPPPTTATINDPGHAHPLDNGPGPSKVVGGANSTFAGGTATRLDATVASAVTGITASVDIAPFPSGPLGSGGAMSLVPAVGVVNWQIRLA